MCRTPELTHSQSRSQKFLPLIKALWNHPCLFTKVYLFALLVDNIHLVGGVLLPEKKKQYSPKSYCFVPSPFINVQIFIVIKTIFKTIFVTCTQFPHRRAHRPGSYSSRPLQDTALCPRPEYQKDEETKTKTKDTALGPLPEHCHD